MFVDPVQDDHAYLVRANDRLVAKLRRDLAASVVAIINQEMAGMERLDTITYVRIMHAIDTGPLTRMYGAFPGDQRSGLLAATLSSTRLAYVLAFRHAMRIVRRHVSAGFLRSLRSEVENANR